MASFKGLKPINEKYKLCHNLASDNFIKKLAENIVEELENKLVPILNKILGE